MRDLDEQDGALHYALGPGRYQRTRGPVIEAYADGAIDHHCPACGAEPLQFCRHDGGALRTLPCPARLHGGTA